MSDGRRSRLVGTCYRCRIENDTEAQGVRARCGSATADPSAPMTDAQLLDAVITYERHN